MPLECNYDVGNSELLAINQSAFEEWSHWLEGAKHTVILSISQTQREYIHISTPGTLRLMPCPVCMTAHMRAQQINLSYYCP